MASWRTTAFPFRAHMFPVVFAASVRPVSYFNITFAFQSADGSIVSALTPRKSDYE